MLHIYLKTAWRNLIRHQSFSVLNVSGLAISLTAVLLMALYIEDELSFDRFNKNAQEIYRVVDNKQTKDVLIYSAQTAAPVAPALVSEFPVVKQAVRLINSESLVRYNDKIFEERKIFFTDESIFSVFSFDMLEGNPNTALKSSQTVVITNSIAEKYFGKEPAMGKTLLLDGKPFKVTGVIKDVPANSHVQFDLLISMKTAEAKDSGYDWMFSNWYSNNFHTYVLLPKDDDIKKLQTQMAAFDSRHKEQKGNTVHHYQFEKLTDIYLHSDRENQIGKTGSIRNIYIFSAIAFFILLIACINFINLSTARSVVRGKEIAVKKVAGADRHQMAIQFFTESFLLCGIAMIIALTITYAVLPFFSQFSGKIFSLQLFSLTHISAVFVLLLAIGLLSGTYPAVVLSSFNPVNALKGKIKHSAWNIVTRKGLVVFQFTISIILIVSSLVVYNQMKYMQTQDLGFSSAQTMVINFEGDKHVKERMEVIKQELKKIAGIQSITASSNVPGDGNTDNWSMDFIKKAGDTIHTELPIYTGDFNYMLQYKIQMLAGRPFSTQYAEDSTTSMLINEAAVKQLGFRSAEEAMGVKVGIYPTDAVITGIIKDFHFESLQKTVSPLAMRILPFRYRLLSIAINSKNISQTINEIQDKWKRLIPERPMEYAFLDESFNRQYEAEMKFGQVFNLFAVLSILIAYIGLFGLSLFSMQQRLKEIGVRKVLGASLPSLWITLMKGFASLVSISILIASPIAYYCMNNWLSDFAYRTSINIWTFIIAGTGAMMIAVITISYQTIKASLSNPVKNLRTE